MTFSGRAQVSRVSKAPVQRKPSPRVVTDRVFGLLCVLPSLAILAVVVGVPIVYVVMLSLQHRDLYLTEAAQGSWAAMSNYSKALRDPGFLHSLSILATWVAASVAGQFVIGFSLALLLNKLVRFRGLIRGAFLLPWILPSAATTLLWLYLFSPQIGPINYVLSLVELSRPGQVWFGDQTLAMPALVMTNIWRGFPFHMLILLAAIQTVPGEILEAAKMDGANSWQRLRFVVLPHIRFVVALDLIIATIWQTQNYVSVQVLTQGGPGDSTEVSTHYIYRIAFERFNFGEAAAMSVVLLAGLLLISGAILRLIGGAGQREK